MKIMPKHKAFIPFIMGGHPSVPDSVQAILTLAEIGSDIIELGVPFSDPVADGEVNQRAAEIALQQGTSLKHILEIVRQVREQDCEVPIILFSYLNPILAFGYEKFAEEASKVGIQGILIVDLPPEEGKEIYSYFQKTGLEVVLLVSPTTDPMRFNIYRELSPCFLYYISRLAVTGMQIALSLQLEQEIKSLREHFPHQKIAVGFGISNAAQAGEVAYFADGVIVGSALVNTLEEQGMLAFRQLAKQIAENIHNKS